MTDEVPAVLKKGSLWRKLRKQRQAHVFVLLGIAFLLVFSYIPMIGIMMAFRQYEITSGLSGIFTDRWVGLQHFIYFFKDPMCGIIIRNTVVISVLKLLILFPLAIVFAIMICETANTHFRRIVQTVSYLPHFVSWVVVYGLIFSILSVDDGILNQGLVALGVLKEPLQFLTDPQYIWGVLIVSDAWKELGWSAIIFIAAITGINPSLYESAEMDGAGRLRRIWHITLPGIKGTVSILLILNLGNLLGGGFSGSNFEQCLLLGNPMNADKAEIITTYVLKLGLGAYSGGGTMFSYATAIGLLGSVFSLVLILGSNYLSKRFQGQGLF